MITLPQKKIAVTPIFDPDRTPGGLYVPDIAKERCDQGIVKYVGMNTSGELQVGDYVLFSGYSGTLLNLEDEGMLIILEEDFVTAKLVDPPNIELHSLYFRGVDGDFFPATFEQAINLIARQFAVQGQTVNAKLLVES